MYVGLFIVMKGKLFEMGSSNRNKHNLLNKRREQKEDKRKGKGNDTIQF
jgi:hypothetical protein